jgi:hypothetical protein
MRIPICNEIITNLNQHITKHRLVHILIANMRFFSLVAVKFYFQIAKEILQRCQKLLTKSTIYESYNFYIVQILFCI